VEYIKTPPFDSESVDIGLCHFLFGLVSLMKPRIVVEAGTYLGHSALVMARALRDAEPEGLVWTADVERYPEIDALLAQDVGSRIRFCEMDFAEMLRAHLAPRSVNLAFVDSGPVPGKPGVPTTIRWDHYEAVKPYVAPQGIIVVDDVAKRDWAHCEDIRREAKLVLPFARGVAIVQR